MSIEDKNLLGILQMYVDAGVNETVEGQNNMVKTSEKKVEPTIQKIDKNIMTPVEASSLSESLVAGVDSLDQLKEIVTNFKGCSICKTATNTVFAEGVDTADVMLIGEAPGANEDAQGIPFCGDSGKLLDKVISSIGLFRSKNAYITNTVFWRPPGNRRPTDEELAICRPFVEKHIALIKPKIIIMVGSTASHALFGDLGPVSKQRSKVFDYKNKYLAEPIKSVVTFHPSYLLRQPSQKKAAWQDMLFIKRILEN